MSHPYADLPTRAFWRTAVAEADRDSFPGLYQPRVMLDASTRVATAGSCFAQHIGRYLRMAGCTVCDAEPAPRGMSDPIAATYGYGVFSARYGNIYTARQLRQLLEEITGGTDQTIIWPLGERFVDAKRPTIEPNGFVSAAEVTLNRQHHLAKVAHMLRETDVFIFTLGLTEAWLDDAGTAFPLCPGVAGGTFDAASYRFHNFTTSEVLADLHAIHDLLRGFNPSIELLLTVSPVPLTATATDAHVMAATTYSKAVLRAAVGEFVAATDDTDYMPSYEIVTAPASGGPWFAPNMRNVSPAGVDKVMAIFLAAHGLLDGTVPTTPTPQTTFDDDEGDENCDEALLQAFAK